VIEEQGMVEGDLRKEVFDEHQAAHRNRPPIAGSATAANLPVRGQRTHTNARTRKGPAQGNGRAEEEVGGKKRRTQPLALSFFAVGSTGERFKLMAKG